MNNNEIHTLTLANYREFMQEAKLRTYIYNRQRTPEITVEEWTKIFGVDAYLYEIYYQEILK